MTRLMMFRLLALTYVLTMASFIMFVIAGAAGIFIDEMYFYYRDLAGGAGMGAGLLAIATVLSLRCRVCRNPVLAPPWRREADERLPFSQVVCFLVGKKCSCDKCGSNLLRD